MIVYPYHRDRNLGALRDRDDDRRKDVVRILLSVGRLAHGPWVNVIMPRPAQRNPTCITRVRLIIRKTGPFRAGDHAYLCMRHLSLKLESYDCRGLSKRSSTSRGRSMQGIPSRHVMGVIDR